MPYPSLPKDPSLIPISSIYIPGTGWVALQGVTPTTDGSGNQSAPVSAALYGKVTNPGDTPVLLDSSGRVLISLAQVAGNTIATAATGIMKVGVTDGTGTAITSTSAALDVNIKSGGGSGFSVVDEASWTAGTSPFEPMGGVFNDSAAALTSGQQGTARLTNNRGQHVNLRDASGNQLLGSKTSANSVPVVVASDQGSVPVSVQNVNANGQTTMSASAPVVIASDQSKLSTNTPDISATGTITTSAGAGSTVVASFGAGITSWSVDLRGTFSAGTTLNFQGSLDGTNFFSVFGVPVGATTDALVSSVVGGSALQYQGNATGLQKFQISCSAIQGGDSITTKIIGSVASDGGFISRALPSGTNVIGSTTIQATSGTSLVADQSNTELRTSLYGKSTTAGDTPVATDASGNVGVNVIGVLPAGTNNIGKVNIQAGGNSLAVDNTNVLRTSLYGKVTAAGDTPVLLDASGRPIVNINTMPTVVTTADTTIGGTTAPTKELLVAGKTNDGTPQYQPIPEGVGGRSVIVEGYSGGTAVPISGTFWQATQPVSGTVTANAGTGNFNNASVGSDGSAIPASSTLVGASDGTNLQQLLVESATNRNLRVGIYNAGSELAIDAGGRTTSVVQAVAGTALSADQTNSELRVSNYGKSTTAGDTALAVNALGSVRIDGSGVSSVQPVIVQKANAVTGSGVKTLAIAFSGNVVAGNSIVVALGMGEVQAAATITLAVTDSLANTYTQAIYASQSTTLESSVFYASNIAGGANTVTVTIAGASSVNTAIAAEVYEVSGLLTQSPGVLDVISTGSNAGSTAVATGQVAPFLQNEIAFSAIAAAGGTITAGTNWTLDSGTLSPTGGNLVSFGSESFILSTQSALTGTATLGTSNAWCAALATFRPLVVPSPIRTIQNTVYTLSGLTAGWLNADLLPSTDIGSYGYATITVTGTWTGTITLQYSDDNVTFTAFSSIYTSGGVASSTITANNQYVIKGFAGRYLRLRMTSYTSGTANATITFYTGINPVISSQFVSAAQNSTWTVGLSNGDITAVTSAAYTTTQTQADQTNTAAKGIKVVLDMTTVGTGSVTLEVDAKDVASGKYYALLTGAAVTTNSTNVYTVYPGLTPSANAIVSDVLPKTWRVKVVANNANSATYSVGASYLL